MYTTCGTLRRVMILSLLSLCLLQAPLWGEEASKDVPSPQAFVLTVHENLLSLRAREASLKAILAQIGREMAGQFQGPDDSSLKLYSSPLMVDVV